MKKPAYGPFRPFWIPCLAALCALAAGLARPLAAPFPDIAGAPRLAGAPAFAEVPGFTEARLRSALPGKTFVRVGPEEWRRIVALHGTEGRVILGSATAPLPADAAPGDSSGPRPLAAASEGPSQADPCPRADSLSRSRCLDSLSRASAPRALREIEGRRRTVQDTAGVGPGGALLPREGRAARDAEDAEAVPDDVQEARNRGYVANFVADLGKGGSWDADEWAVVIYVVVGVIVVGAFVLGGAKALYDLAMNKEESPVFKEAALQFSYSGRSLRAQDGAALFRDAWLMGGRFAIGVEKPYLSLGLALEGGSIDLSVRALDADREIVDARGGYLVGGPLVRFGRYRPLSFTLEFLNGTSSHSSIGWISKSRMTLAAKARGNLLYGAHLGAVFYDLRFTDGLVVRRGDFNRDLSLLFGLDAGWAF